MVPPSSGRVSRAPPYSRTPISPYPYGAVTRSGAPFQALPVRRSGPLAWSAFARRYWRSRGCFPFLRLVRYFSSPGSPRRPMDSAGGTAPQGGGLPHSEILGSAGARPFPRLIAACHVLHRLSVPRHPPDALVLLALSLACRSPPHARRQARERGAGPRLRAARPGPAQGPFRAEHNAESHLDADRASSSRAHPCFCFGQSCLRPLHDDQRTTRAKPPPPQARAAFGAIRVPGSETAAVVGPG